MGPKFNLKIKLLKEYLSVRKKECLLLGENQIGWEDGGVIYCWLCPRTFRTEGGFQRHLFHKHHPIPKSYTRLWGEWSWKNWKGVKKWI